MPIYSSLFPPRPIRSPISFRIALTWLCVLASVASMSAQTTVYSNLATDSSAPVQTWSGLYKVGQSFTSSQSGSIASLTLNLGSTNASTIPVYSVELWSDGGGASSTPSALLATFVSSQHWSNLYTPSVDATNRVTFSSSEFSENYSVAANTTYWLVVASTSGSAKYWGLSSSGGTASALYDKTTSTWSNTTLSGPLGAEIAVSPVPEPSAGAACAGLAALGFAALRRRKRV